MNEPQPDSSLSKDGEAFAPVWSIKWIDPKRIEAGEAIVPAKLSSPLAHEFAAMNLVSADLKFAHDCFAAASQLGIPDHENLQITALIFSGVISYARSFKSGVRKARLDPQLLASSGAAIDLEIHDYLIALRDKHVAHSVNDFEECQATAVVVGRFGHEWRDGSGIGIIMKRSVGLSAVLLRRAIAHVAIVQQIVADKIEVMRSQVYAEFKVSFERDKKWEMAPIVHFSDRRLIAKPRK